MNPELGLNSFTMVRKAIKRYEATRMLAREADLVGKSDAGTGVIRLTVSPLTSHRQAGIIETSSYQMSPLLSHEP
jgi:hypothetical protein